MASQEQHRGRGNEQDYLFGTTVDGWKGPPVVRWRSREALGEPYELEITVSRRSEDGALDLPAYLGTTGTLRIASMDRWRPVHGLITGADEIERTRAMFLYRFVLSPLPFGMTQRVRYRTFVDQTLRQILVALLENRSVAQPGGAGGLAESSSAPAPSLSQPSFDEYTSPAGRYRFAVSDSSRLDDTKLRSYVVQYGESDHDLFHRLLEEEGLTYFYEHSEDESVLAIVDRPGQVSPLGRQERYRLRNDLRGTGADEPEIVRSLKSAERLVWGGTTARAWDPARSQTPQQGNAIDDVKRAGGETSQADAALFAHDLFPSRDEEVGTPCITPATLAVERRACGRSRKVGRSTIRMLEPGLKMTVGDEGGVYEDQVVVVTSVTTFATQLLPEDTLLDEEPWGLNGRGHRDVTYENEFTALPEDIPYRPELRTPPPRIHGIQTAVVSADEAGGDPPEIHINEESCVRLRFPWDERIEQGKPSSRWIRVSNPWAGAGFGDVFVPRVGQEVLVAYLGGDPERPLVVGRVYNATNPIPYTKPTISTIKTKSSPKSDGYNELRFDDDAGKEEVYLQAEKNLNELVKNGHSTSVGGDQSNSVGGNQSNDVKGSRTHHVVGDETHTVDACRTTNINTNDTHNVAGILVTTVKGPEGRQVESGRMTTIFGVDFHGIKGHDQTIVEGGGQTLHVSGHRKVVVGGKNLMSSNLEHLLKAPEVHLTSGGAFIKLSGNIIELNTGSGASISMIGAHIRIKAAGDLRLSSAETSIRADGDIQAAATTIKLNG